MLQWIGNALSWILAKMAAITKFFADLTVAAFNALWDLARDLFCWLLDQALDLVIEILSVLDLSGITSQLGSFAGVPAMMLEVLSALGVTTALGMITVAIGIRFVLQLIPFTRLGS